MKMHACLLSSFSHIQLFVTPWTVAHQGPLCSWDFLGKNTGGGLPPSPPGDLPNPGIEPTFLMSPALAGGFFTTSTTWEAPEVPLSDRVNFYCLELWVLTNRFSTDKSEKRFNTLKNSLILS